MKETLSQTKKMFSDYVSSVQKDDDDHYMPMSSVKKPKGPNDGQEDPGQHRREYESYYKSLQKQVEIIYNELQRLG